MGAEFELLNERAALLDQSKDAILSRDMDDRVYFWNKGAERLFGWTMDETIGHFLPDLLRPEPDAYQHARQRLLVDGGWTGDLKKRTKKGTELIVECRWTLIRDAAGKPHAVLATDTDVTEKRRAEAQLRLAAVVFEQTQDAIIVTDATGAICMVNRAFAAQTGHAPEEAMGKALRMLDSGRHDAAFFDVQRRELVRDGRWHGELWLRRKSGESYPAWMSVTVVHASPGPECSVHIVLDLSEYKELTARIEHLTFRDPLTELPNRALFNEFLRRALAQAERQRGQVALLFLDIDRFKEVNDTEGHEFGDQVIVEVAQRFKTVLRHDEMLARIDGDDFALLASVQDQAEARAIAERWERSLAEPLAVSGRSVSLSASIGIALYPHDGATSDELLKHADIAMSWGKQNGRKHDFFRPEMSQAVARQARLARSLRLALDCDGFELHYQPFVDLHSGCIAGAEALLRWPSSGHGWISPAEFVPIAERYGLGAPLDDWVLAQACRQMRTWLESGLPFPGRLAVNIGAPRIGHPDYPARARSIVEAAGLAPALFELEITETSALADPEGAVKVLLELKAAGFALAVDDFGTGYSSLSYLTRYPLDKVKIDLSFVRDMRSDPKAHAIVLATLAMARGIGLKSLAEGVESTAQHYVLRELGCNLGQGYNFDRPLPPTAFAGKWLRRKQ